MALVLALDADGIEAVLEMVVEMAARSNFQDHLRQKQCCYLGQDHLALVVCEEASVSVE